MSSPLFRPVALLAATLALGACSTYDGYGYSGVSVGYGSYGGYASPYYGWYDGFYYPGTGYYVYDRYGSRHRWGDRHRRYWESRRGDRRVRDNWSDYRREARRERRQDNREWRRDRRQDNREARRDRRRDNREARRDRRNSGNERRGWRTRRDD